MSLEARSLTLAYDGEAVVRELSVRVRPGEITALVGPNASGKSTLLRGLARLLAPAGGAVHLDGEAIAKLPTREVARRMAVLPQGPGIPEGVRVRELVAQGRYPHRRILRQWSRADEAAVERAMALTAIGGLADRRLDELSGGQRQHAWIAMTLAQESRVMLLDEPTTYLDMRHQVQVMELLRRLNRTGRRTIVIVLHDLNQAARYASQLVAIREGRIAAAGSAQEVVSEPVVRDVFGLEVCVVEDPVTGGPLCVPALWGGPDETADPTGPGAPERSTALGR